MTTISIPTTIKSAGKQLSGIDKLLTAREWERAAIVWAFTEAAPGRRTDLARTGARLSIAEFARQGIRGLTKRDAVAEYRRIWQAAIDDGFAPECEPGDDVVLPTIEWPGRQDAAGQRRYIEKDPEVIARAINKMPAEQRDALAGSLNRGVIGDLSNRETSAQRAARGQATPVEYYEPPNLRKVARDDARISMGQVLGHGRHIRELRDRIDREDWPDVKEWLDDIVILYSMLADYYADTVSDDAIRAFIEGAQS